MSKRQKKRQHRITNAEWALLQRLREMQAYAKYDPEAHYEGYVLAYVSVRPPIRDAHLLDVGDGAHVVGRFDVSHANYVTMETPPYVELGYAMLNGLQQAVAAVSQGMVQDLADMAEEAPQVKMGHAMEMDRPFDDAVGQANLERVAARIRGEHTH